MPNVRYLPKYLRLILRPIYYLAVAKFWVAFPLVILVIIPLYTRTFPCRAFEFSVLLRMPLFCTGLEAAEVLAVLCTVYS